MRLTAIYIPAKTLPYLFGSNHKGQILNLGGRYFYEIEEQEESLNIKNRYINDNFIEDFWGNGVSLISAFVGRNGTGKTTILRAIHHEADSKHQNVLYLFETEKNSSKVYILNETSKEITSNLILAIEDFSKQKIEKLYYSPVLDYELQDTRSAISLISYAKGNLEQYYFDSITRNILFLNEPVIEEIKRVYPDFPSYEKYFIGVAQHRKYDFKRPYIDANMGNPNKAGVAINYVDGEIPSLTNEIENRSFSKDDVIAVLAGFKSILEGDSFTSLFNWLWELEEYKCSNEFENIHNGDDFTKNLEVTLLSYLILGAVFPQTGLHGGFDFRKELNDSSFFDKLDKLLEYYFSNTYEVLYKIIKKSISKIEIDKRELILEIIDSDNFTKLQGVKTERLKKLMKKDLEMFSTIKDFYKHFVSLIKNKVLTSEGGSLVFHIDKSDISIYNKIVEKYKLVLDSLRFLPVIPSIIQFVPDKKLSSGEKSLVDFYASVNNYIDRFKFVTHQSHENYLLLLDEPELGYHPIWKKKFVSAITKTLPILFSKITPHTYNKTSNEYIAGDNKNPTLQIIFTTHDPLTLSDIPYENITYLSKTEDVKVSIIDGSIKKSFGANIHELLADSFFVDEGLIGDFAKEKIETTINWINKNRDIVNRKNNFSEELEIHKKVIALIDEPVLGFKLSEMIGELVEDVSLQELMLQKEIDYLINKKNNL